MERNRSAQLGNIRALAIVLVVFGHSIILYSSSWNLYETAVSAPLLDLTKRIVDIPQMLLFFALSGYLFAFTHGKKRGILHLLKSKAKRLLVPYLGVGLCFLLPIRLAIGFPSYRGLTPAVLAEKFLTGGDVGHLWFLPGLFCTFLLCEGLLLMLERIPGLRRCPEVGLCVIALGLYLEGYRIGFGYGPLLNAYNYLIWFSIGYFLNIHRELLRKVYAVPVVKWLLILLNAALIVWRVSGQPMRVLVSMTMQGLCVLNAFGAMPERSCGILEKIDRNSFGIYLFHSPLIYITFATMPNATPWVVVGLNFVVFGAVAYGLTEALRRSKLKFLIGE